MQLESHPRSDLNAAYLLTGLSTRVTELGGYRPGQAGGTDFSYQNQFRALPYGKYHRPARTTPRPVVQGPQTAVVVGPAGEEIHTDKYGRVKVQFHWDREGKRDDKSSCWLRVSQNWAGKNWGAFFLPRIGQEVIVDFLEGDPDRPIVTGRVYHAESMPPLTLPAEKTRSTIKTRSTKGGSAANFNEIRFEDEKGKEELYIHAEKDKKGITENNETLEVGKDRSRKVGQNEKVEVGKDREVKITGDQKFSIGGSSTLDIGGDYKITVTGDEQHKASSIVLEAQKDIELKVGASTIKLEASGQITIQGIKVSLEGAATVDVQGAIVKLN
jgi:type VI secretion system secreted protein VgrG